MSASQKAEGSVLTSLRGVVAALPSGDGLSGESWSRRHTWIVRLLWIHVLLLPVYGVIRGVGAAHSLLEGGLLLGGLAVAARSPRLRNEVRATLATGGLVASSAVLVHFSGGLIEMHFHFFVMVVVVSLYQSWRPFLAALGIVVIHHGVVGTLAPASVYDHPAAIANPWGWALVHGAFILAISVASVVAWRVNENALLGERRALGELAAAQRLAGVGSWDWDLLSEKTTWSQELSRLLQVESAPTLETFLERVHPEDRDRVASLLRTARETGGDLDYECRLLLPDGTTRTIHARGTSVADGDGRPARMRGTCQDVTERRALEQEVERRALYDDLTGLANRALFLDRLEHALAAHARTATPTAVLYLDLDGFKAVNDRYGHLTGDELLVEVASRLRRCGRGSDTVARLGGDEFALILQNAELTEARAIAERVHHELAAPLSAGEDPQWIAASIGITELTGRHHDPDDVLREADAAMYAAKAAGRGRHETYVPGIEQTTTVTLPDVAPHQALAWASYMHQLRREIADSKLAGRIAPQTRAPETVHRTLERTLIAISELPDDAASATLILPALRELEEFVFHQTAVQHWADALVSQGTLTTSRSADADAFWAHLEHHITTAPAVRPTPSTSLRQRTLC